MKKNINMRLETNIIIDKHFHFMCNSSIYRIVYGGICKSKVRIVFMNNILEKNIIDICKNKIRFFYK